MLPYEEYVRREVEDLTDYAKSEAVQKLCQYDLDQVKKAYDGYCRSRYEMYKLEMQGGNPATMLPPDSDLKKN